MTFDVSQANQSVNFFNLNRVNVITLETVWLHSKWFASRRIAIRRLLVVQILEKHDNLSQRLRDMRPLSSNVATSAELRLRGIQLGSLGFRTIYITNDCDRWLNEGTYLVFTWSIGLTSPSYKHEFRIFPNETQSWIEFEESRWLRIHKGLD